MVFECLILLHRCLVVRSTALLRDARNFVAIHLDSARDALLVLTLNLDLVVRVFVLGVLLSLILGSFESRSDALRVALLGRFCVFFLL